MPRSNDEKTREFQQKMHTQGAAGFGSGPWSEIEESLGMDQSVVVDQEGNPVWSVKHTRKPRTAGARSAFDRLLGGVAVLATATLVTSVLAIYYEQTRETGSSQLASSDVVTDRNDSDSIVLPHPPATGFIDRPAIEVVAMPDDRPDSAQEPLDTVAQKAGNELPPAMAALDAGQDLPSTEPAGDIRTGDPATGPVETLPALALLDSNEHTATVDTPAVDTGNPATADSAAPGRNKTATGQAADAPGSVTARAQPDTPGNNPDVDVDTPASNTVVALSPDTVEAIEEITRQESPAAIGGPATAQVKAPQADASTAGKAAEPAPAGTQQEPAMTVDIHIAVGQPVSPDTGVTVAASSSAGTVAQVETATVQETGTEDAAPAPENTAHLATDSPEPAPSAAATLPVTASPEDKKDTDTLQLAQVDPAAPEMPSPARVATTGPANPVASVMHDVPQPGTTGRWIINLASYAGPKTADRMQRKFEGLGVNTDRQVAEVNGKTMYRLRIASFESRGDAQAYFDSIKETLGLESAWITRQ